MRDTSISTSPTSIQNEIKFDISKIKLYTIDIETTAEYGFPDVNDPQEELLAITVQEASTKKITPGASNHITLRKNLSIGIALRI